MSTYVSDYGYALGVKGLNILPVYLPCSERCVKKEEYPVEWEKEEEGDDRMCQDLRNDPLKWE